MNEHETPADEIKIVTFTLGSRHFGIDMRSLIEIREWAEPTPLPSVPGYILGVTNLRGTVVLLVVNIAGKQAGFLVDEVDDIVAIQESAIQAAPDVELQDSNVISGLVQITARARDGSDPSPQMVLLLDLDALSITRHLDLAA